MTYDLNSIEAGRMMKPRFFVTWEHGEYACGQDEVRATDAAAAIEAVRAYHGRMGRPLPATTKFTVAG